MNETYKKIIRILIYILVIIFIYQFIQRIFYTEQYTTTPIVNLKIGISTTVKNPHKLNDWIKYHLNIGFERLYIVFDNEDEDTSLITKSPKVQIFKNDTNWKQQISTLANMDQFINDTKEVMSRQITNFANVRNYAKKDGIDWLLHIDGDELFYPESTPLNTIFNQTADSISFQNLEMIPKRDNYDNCFKEGIDFKVNSRIFNAYSNGKSAVKVNSSSEISGVHGFFGGKQYVSSIGKILHYPSCNFDEYISKYKILGKFEDKWWNSVQIPFKFHTESRDIITECSAREALGEANACENSVREYYNKSNVYNKDISPDDVKTIEFVRDQLLI
jgi:hypothetical protein